MLIMATAVCGSLQARSSASTITSLQTEGVVGQSPPKTDRFAAENLIVSLGDVCRLPEPYPCDLQIGLKSRFLVDM
jgi:hypothetical protein